MVCDELWDELRCHCYFVLVLVSNSFTITIHKLCLDSTIHSLVVMRFYNPAILITCRCQTLEKLLHVPYITMAFIFHLSNITIYIVCRIYYILLLTTLDMSCICLMKKLSLITAI